MNLPPDLAEKAAAHLPTCAYIAVTIWLWLVVAFLAVVGVVFILVGVIVGVRDMLRKKLGN